MGVQALMRHLRQPVQGYEDTLTDRGKSKKAGTGKSAVKSGPSTLDTAAVPMIS